MAAPLRAKGSVFQILAPQNLKELWYLNVLARRRRRKSLWRVLFNTRADKGWAVKRALRSSFNV